MKLYIIRHGQSMSNVGNYSDEYNIDPHLTDRGVMQAKLLGDRLSSTEFDCIISSPMVRAVETVAQTAERQHGNPQLELLPTLAETGTPKDFVPNMSHIRKVYENVKIIPGLTGYESEYERATAIIKYLRARFTGDKNILVSCHGTFNTYLLAAAIGYEPPKELIISQHNAALNLVEYFIENGDVRIRLKYMNDVRHLPYELLT